MDLAAKGWISSPPPLHPAPPLPRHLPPVPQFPPLQMGNDANLPLDAL